MINKQLINLSSPATSGGLTEAESGLILHLDANDVDSYDGDGAEWFDISSFNKSFPLSDDPSNNLRVHYNPSDSDSYSGSGTTMNNLALDSLDATVVANKYGSDAGGFFDVSTVTEGTIVVPNGHPLDGNAFTLEFWFNWKATPSGAERFIYEPSTGWNFFYYAGNGWRINNGDCATGYFANNVAATAGEWNHFAMSQGTSSCNIYINGTLQKTQAVTSGTRNIDSFHFGSTSLDGVNCKIGAIRMYNTAITADKIGQNYRHGRDFVYTDLIDDTDLELHLDAASFADGSTNTPSTWTALTGSNGTITNATFDSELGNYLDFDGSGDKVTIGTQSYFHSTNDFTAELWVKKITTNEDLIFKLGSTHPTYYLLYNHSVGFWFLDYTTSPRREIRTGPLTGIENQWTHITLVVDGGNIAPKIYVNGEQKISSVFTPVGSSGGTSGNKDLIIGEGYAAAAWGDWEGKIGQIRWYSSKLTQDQIRQNYNFTKPNYPNGNDGTITGATWNSAGYFDFDGSTNDVKLNTSNFFSNDFTLSMWWKLDSTSGYQMLFGMQGYGNSSYNGIGHYINGSTIHTWVQMPNSTTEIGNTSSILSTGTWHNIVLLREGSTWKHYLDGALVGTYANKTSAAMNSPESKIGEHFNSPGYNTDGKCSKVKLYNKALSPTEITEIYTEGE